MLILGKYIVRVVVCFSVFCIVRNCLSYLFLNVKYFVECLFFKILSLVLKWSYFGVVKFEYVVYGKYLLFWLLYMWDVSFMGWKIVEVLEIKKVFLMLKNGSSCEVVRRLFYGYI